VRLDAAALPPGAIAAVELDGHEYVVWRGRSGRLGSAPRSCPHLDHDLADGYVVDDELVCAGHGWAFDGRGHVYKRNELGRVDPKGAVCTLTLRESAGHVDVERDDVH
jgi:phenylpropionate dioxygenase-like ring-hydroxylating dioxygenase large terminal subunit